MRAKCPIHWTEKFEEFPEEDGFWSVTTADDIHTVSRDWETYSSELGGVLAARGDFPLELARAMFIGMDPPKHDRLKALFQRGFTPKRIADHEAVDPRDHEQGARPARRPGRGGPRRGCRPARRLARDPQLHGGPRGGRRDVGAPDELGARRRRPGHQPRRRRRGGPQRHPGDLRALPRADRRERASRRATTSRACSSTPRSTGRSSRSTRSSWASSCWSRPATTRPRRRSAARCAR